MADINNGNASCSGNEPIRRNETFENMTVCDIGDGFNYAVSGRIDKNGNIIISEVSAIPIDKLVYPTPNYPSGGKADRIAEYGQSVLLRAMQPIENLMTIEQQHELLRRRSK